MASYTFNQPVISDDVAAFLQEAKLLSGVFDGKRKISTAMISPPSTIPSASSSFTSTRISSSSFSATYTTQEIDEVEIPVMLQSVESYEFLGFNHRAAQALWQLYVSQPHDMQADFFDFVKWHVRDPLKADASSGHDDWIACMTTLGICQKLQSALLLPEYSDLRGTASCKFWLLDAMEMSYRVLQELDSDLRTKRAHIQQGRKPLQKVFSGRPKAESFSSIPSLASPAGRNEGGATTSDRPTSSIPPSIEEIRGKSGSQIATVSDAPVSLDPHTMLWGAGHRSRHEEFYDEGTGKVDIGAIAASPGDFSGRAKVTYFTPQRNVADRYAQWQKHKVALANITVLQVAVPWAFVESLNMEHLWFGDCWKEVVWWSRRRSELPKELENLEEKDLFIGHIVTGKDSNFIAFSSPDLIKEDAVLTVKVNGEEEKAIQWTFRGRKVEKAFNTHCHGKVWLHQLSTLCTPKQSV
ncbi:MAG: hypothetical protein FRX48_00292 [Lasallia pustulata]|uniref:Uncharacterized protein n=1 Tax=Lasallia pustulata TaxID=136370 RepID=A0A5M8Q0C2_9LECA|nr:MAG: hypothetical protein FRX48_00292 [Lasallia pustulata]